jgi:glucose/arabinose dehydrogenase
VESGVSAHALLTEKFGEVRIPRKGGLDPAPVTGGPQNILQEGDSGLLDVALDPAFETNQTVLSHLTKVPKSRITWPFFGRNLMALP